MAGLPESLGWKDVIDAMATAHGERGGKHARAALESNLSSADEDMANKIANAIEHIGQQVGHSVVVIIHDLGICDTRRNK